MKTIKAIAVLATVLFATNILYAQVPSSVAYTNLSPLQNVTQQTNQVINAFTATNLEQWKSMIPALKYSANLGRWNSWVMEQTNRTSGIPVQLEKNGQTVSYNVQFIDVDIYKDSENVCGGTLTC